MVHIIKTLGAPGLAVAFLTLIVGIVLVIRQIMAYQGRKILNEAGNEGSILIKKYPVVAERSYAGVTRNLGFVISLALVISIFEFPTAIEEELLDLGKVESDFTEMEEIPPTRQETPPPPKIRQPEIVAVSNEVEIENEIEIDLDVEMDEETVVEQMSSPEVFATIPEEEEEVEEIFQVVEESAEPIGGYDAFYQSIRENLSYPIQAKNLGVDGKVYVQFIVDKDGSLSEVKVARGIGAGCDEEAIRVVKMAGKWNPGKQRGRPVRQYKIIPITFKLHR